MPTSCWLFPSQSPCWILWCFPYWYIHWYLWWVSQISSAKAFWSHTWAFLRWSSFDLSISLGRNNVTREPSHDHWLLVRHTIWSMDPFIDGAASPTSGCWCSASQNSMLIIGLQYEQCIIDPVVWCLNTHGSCLTSSQTWRSKNSEEQPLKFCRVTLRGRNKKSSPNKVIS